jgi:hypothetical protein
MIEATLEQDGIALEPTELWESRDPDQPFGSACGNSVKTGRLMFSRYGLVHPGLAYAIIKLLVLREGALVAVASDSGTVRVPKK